MDNRACQKRVVLLAGGVGGARLALGLSRVIPDDRLSIVVNVGDDDWFHGLKVCPDLDTVLYTLSGLADTHQGWGVVDDATRALEMLKHLGAAQTWMKLGDRDLGLHIHRSHRMREGARLSSVIAEMASVLRIGARVLPACDEALPTLIHTPRETLRFQEWFVRQKAQPTVTGLDYQGAEFARPAPGVLEAIEAANLIVIAPSNPLLSILPMLAVPDIRSAISRAAAPCIAISPLIGGRAVKGPLVTLMSDLGFVVGNDAIARMYGDAIDGMVIDNGDVDDVELLQASFGMDVLAASTWIPEVTSAAALAGAVLSWGDTVGRAREGALR